MLHVPPADRSVSEAPRWRLQLCGRAQLVSVQGETVTLERRDAAMLALLAIEGPTSRSRIIALLWPDEAADAVRQRLRQRIFALKRKLGVEAVEGQLTLSLAAPLHWPGFDDDAPDKPLLGDDPYAELPEFAQWLAGVRERLQSARRERHAAAASSLEAEGRLAEAIVAAEQLLAFEPLQEHAHRRLMRLHYLRGDRAAALLAFDRCERLLKDEVGATPSAETLELLTQIERSQALSNMAGSTTRRVVPASVLRPPRLIGRDAEWAQLQAAWERGDAIVVIGEAGMGKTRLVSDLVRAHAAAPGSALQVSARPGDERVPYALLGRLLRGVLATRQAPLDAGIEAELARLLPELPQRANTGGTGGAADTARFTGAIESTLQHALASGLQAVVLDDLHFADAASLEMAQHLAGTPGLRWLAAFRGAEIGAPAQALADTLTGRSHAEPIVLQPLTVAQVSELIESLGIEELDAPTLAGALHQRTGGNPLFLLETLKALLLQGDATPTPASNARALTRLPATGNVVRLIERRIGQLSRDAIKLARCAAIAGQDFSAALAARVLDVNPLDLTDAWLELESAQVLRDGAFAHDLIHEAARRSVPEPIARELHRRIAEMLGAEGELRAAPHLAEAGRAALRSMRIREGFEFLDRAQSILGRHGEVDAQMALIDELDYPANLAGTTDEVQRIIEQAIAAATGERQRSMACRSMSSLLGTRGDYTGADEMARRALAHAIAAKDRECELNARLTLSGLQGEIGQAEQGEAILQPIEAWVNEHGSGMQRMELADARAMVLSSLGQTARSTEQWERAIEIAREIGAAHAVPQLLAQLAANAYFLGQAQRSHALHEQSAAAMGELPDHSAFLRQGGSRLMLLERELGRYDSALSRAESILCGPDASPHDIGLARLYLAMVYIDLGQPVRSVGLLEQADAAPPNPLHVFQWTELRVALKSCERGGQVLQKEAVSAAASAIAGRSGRTLFPIWRVLARFAGDDEAIQAARHALDYCAQAQAQGHRVVFQTLLAQRLATTGQTAEAVRLVREAWATPPEVTPSVMYRGQLWRAMIEVLDGQDAALCQRITRTATDWLFRTAADHIPPAFRESFLHRNPANAFLLAKAREL
jgi:DNA-binding SARP family transcriptional activator